MVVRYLTFEAPHYGMPGESLRYDSANRSRDLKGTGVIAPSYRPTRPCRHGPLRSAAAVALGSAALFLAACASLASLPTPSPVQSEPTDPLGPSRQLVVVTAADWSSSSGALQRFERESPASEWKPVGRPFPIVLGASGLAWGRGMHSGVPSTQQRKREGDRKSPAGIFALSAVFGYAAAAETGMASRALPYLQATAGTECVDDPASIHYNSVLERSAGPVDWNSAEHMLRDDDLYRLGVVVDHNTGPARAGAGSCIFIHIWQGPSSTTDGCTAGDPAHIAALVAWLDRNRAPRLVQLPRDEYIAYARAWKLPSPSLVLAPVD